MTKYYGWIPPTQKQLSSVLSALPRPVFRDCSFDIKSSGAGKVVLLSDYVKKLLGRHLVQVQETQDCVAVASAHAVDYTYITDLVIHGRTDEFPGITSSEDIYGGSRHQIGKDELGRDGGSMGAWAAQYVHTYGTLVRQKYDNDDLTKYSKARTDLWGAPGHGTPSYLLRTSKLHRIKTTSQIRTYEEARDSIANGYAVIVASNQGFSNVRDKDGFAKPQGNWAHCMALIGVDDASQRKSCLVLQSWPISWISGPTGKYDIPPGSFWAESSIVDDMLGVGDSWAFSDREAFQPKRLSWKIV